MQDNEKLALVICEFKIFRSVCEVQDTPDPETKILRFREGCEWKAARYRIRGISLWAYWPQNLQEEIERAPIPVPNSKYRVLRKLETLPGYAAVLECTTRAEAMPVEHEPVSNDVIKCESAILDALADEPRLTLYNLKRKTHAERYGELFEKCLSSLEDVGEIRLEQDATVAKRTWVIYSPESSAPAA
jgi:hypothetical protein